MITFEQVVFWGSIFVTIGTAMLYGGAYLITRHYGYRFRREADVRVKEEMLAAERMRAKQEAKFGAALHTEG